MILPLFSMVPKLSMPRVLELWIVTMPPLSTVRVTPELIVREPALAIARVSPVEISTSEDMVTLPDTVQVGLTHESPEPVHHVPRSVAPCTAGTSASKERALRESRANSIADNGRIDFLFEEYKKFAKLYSSAA